jgi:Protein of unknown function (DUF1592)/Protein of unknown function (DUF1588)/Protein of unknown function (DUF1585)/Protein of unknown function (DUF1595)/Protein of unknown function (DUF1587)
MRSPQLTASLLFTLLGAGSIACTSEIEQPGQNPGATGGSSATAGSGGINQPGAGNSGVGGGSSGTAGQSSVCTTTGPTAVKAPLRRLTRFEYNNTVRDVAAVTDAPANLFPPEDVGSGFGTDTSIQSVGDVLAEKYMTTARNLAASLTSTMRIAELAPCAASPAAADEAACARTVIEGFVPKIFRRPLEAGDADDFAQLFQTVRSGGSSFASSLAAVLEVAFQSPEFLYRPELGKAVAGNPALWQPTDYEMASRLSYLFYGSSPDKELTDAAAAGQLSDAASIRAQAERMLGQAKAKDVARYFFDSLLPIQALGSLTRTENYGGFTQEIGHLMRQETQTFLQDQVFNGGTWATALTAPHTFVNDKLAAYYGLTGVTGSEFRKVTLDGQKRAGLMTQAGVLAGPIHSDPNNPVVRGAFVLHKVMCVKISTPPASLGPIVPPDPAKGGTSRERYTEHSKNPECRSCHNVLDPIGFALENFSSVGQWQDMEGGKVIDVAVTSPQLGSFTGAVELGKKLAESEDVQACFATNWANYAYGRASEEQDACTMQQLQETFKTKGYNIKELLLELSQTSTFLYMTQVTP